MGKKLNKQIYDKRKKMTNGNTFKNVNVCPKLIVLIVIYFLFW